MSRQLETAQALVTAGISVFPVGNNKVPSIQWKVYTGRLPTQAELIEWFGIPDRAGVGRVCGAVSGNLETIDFDVDGEVDRGAFPLDSAALVTRWREIVEAQAPGLVDRLTVIRTPRPGWHVVYRCESPVGGNTKLAAVPAEKDGWKCVIETRGEGGYALHPDSPGFCHPSGREYATVSGPAVPVRITAAERVLLLQAARMFNLKPEALPEQRGPSPRPTGSDLKPGDDFNERGTWGEILEPAGFTFVERTSENVEYWKRPGSGNKWSLSCNYAGSGLLYCFSPNCGFDSERGYSKFAALAILRHAGDFEAAARSLSANGFGSASGDISALCTVIPWTGEAVPEAPAPQPYKAPGFPPDLLGVPGIIQAVTEHTNATSFVRQPALALGAAIALMGTICGRKVRDPAGTCPNVYIIGLCPSGGGKERARQVNVDLLSGHKGGELIGPDSFASHAGLINALCVGEPSKLFQVDEIGRVLQSIKGAGSKAGHLHHIPTTLMRLYTSASGEFRSDAYAESDKKNKLLRCPNANLYGTTVPASFWDSLTVDSLTDGFMSRLMIFEGDPEARPAWTGVEICDPPKPVVDMVHFWCAYEPPGGNLLAVNGYHSTVHFAADAIPLMENFQREIVDLQFSGDDVSRALWSRTVEKARKLALIHACSVNHQYPVIDCDAVEWATRLSRFLTERLIDEGTRRVSENQTESYHNRVLRIIQQAGRIDGRALCRRTRWLRPKERADLLADMQGEGLISAHIVPTAGRTKVVYDFCGESASCT